MISYLEGQIKYKSNSFITILAGNVGYKVYLPVNVLSQKNIGEKTSINIYTHVKDDAIDLYGFENQEDLSMFELFLTVSGIGPKTALGIFSVGKLPKIKEAIVKGDVSFFTQIPRLGTKNAQKIIIELRGKLGSIGEFDLTQESGETKEVVEALKTFGFSLSEAKEGIKSLKDFEGTTSDKIRRALKYLGKSS